MSSRESSQQLILVYNKVYADEILLLPPLPEADDLDALSSRPSMRSKEPSPLIIQEERVASPVSDAPSRASSGNYALPSLRVGPSRPGERPGDHRPSLSSISIAGSAGASSHARGSSTASAEAPKGGILLNATSTLGRTPSTRINGHARPSEDDTPLTAKQSSFPRSFSVASSTTTERRPSESKERSDSNPLWGMTSPQPPPAPSSGAAGTAARPSTSTRTSTSTSGAITESSYETNASAGSSTPGRQQGLRRFGSLLRGR